MPSLEDFLRRLEADAVEALTAYNFAVDQASLDLVQRVPEVGDAFQVDAAIEQTGPTWLIRAMTDADTTLNSLRIWYLPWRAAVETEDTTVDGVSRTTLDGTGSGIFLTSKLDACRFTIQPHDAGMKAVTVLHLAGNYGSGLPGAKKREGLETQTLADVPQGAPRRRYSFGRYAKSLKANKLDQINKLPVDGTRTYYDGGQATVLGVRGRDGAWSFYGQRYADERDGGAFDKVQPI